MAYRQLALWLCVGVSLGKGNRMVLPACCVLRIRHEFPDETYVGFREVQEALQMD
ncbi:hypothetical protein HOLleu_03117 [Holothuria leucospilota]|uniref:P2X purinoreceptor 7 intracellular domain-containing protein n=1 Tax=Holothuria leucospilota TaxID=206669 RepID=A0A9Q1CRJ8_HOLLE|nr:hypothetical protein HOLleu_03117 [Holothuria leucospilota]